jgi:anti-sigma B factor antagonist
MTDDEAMPELQMAVSVDGDETVVSVAGDLDIPTSLRLRARLDGLVDEGASTLVIDLAGVGFMDSTGLGTLVGALKHVRQAGGHMALRAPTPAVLRVIEITGLTKVLPIRE